MNSDDLAGLAEKNEDGSYTLHWAVVPAEEVSVVNDDEVTWRGQMFRVSGSIKTATSSGWSEGSSSSAGEPEIDSHSRSVQRTRSIGYSRGVSRGFSISRRKTEEEEPND